MSNRHFWQTLIIGLIIGLLIGIAGKDVWPADLPDDPVQRVAAKVLRGDYPAEWWQRKGYEKIAAGAQVKQRYTAWVTCYSHTDPGCNRTTASGMPVSERVAAMLDQPWGTFVLIRLPGGFELRQVYDTGSRKNRHRAQHPPRDKRGRLVRQPADVWLDRYLPHRSLRSWVVPIFVF